MKTIRRKVGDLGEEIAIRFLENKGFFLVEQNYLKSFGEIDLIMKKDKELFFIEVKSGEMDSGWDPEQNLSTEKLKKLERVVEFYIEEKKLDRIKNSFGIEQKLEYQMMAVIVYLDKKNKKAEVKIINELYF